ncbi:unnamed protein product [Cercopithifilaria johnstoni]|uniref:USP domain-containing protein n=1 Tax=Cercopithifilaria johnstoni TaxID=2874296 RepID=A0A8J2M8V6_9BILA|nr:unnamed protein product [Cercopithifilaria johnstoni]
MMTLVLKPGQFSVKVIYGIMNAAPTKRMGILTVSEVRKEVIFLFGDCHLVASFGALSGFPWFAPSENRLGFWIKGREDMVFVIEFEDYQSMMAVHKLVDRNQNVNPADVESVKKWLDRFTLDASMEPTAKRSRLSNPLSGITYGLMQVENPLIRSRNSAGSRGVSLASFYDGISPSGKDRSGSIGVLGIGNVETSGFANLGNTCYMNSILQGVFADAIFTKDLFKFCKMVEELGLNLDEEMPLSLAVANLASRRHRATIQLKKALLEMIKTRAHFLNNAQQDAHEFLVSILNYIQEECDRMLCKQYDIADKQERARKNPVTSNFAFVIESTIKCNRCKTVTKNEEESVILPVSFQMLEQDVARCLIVFLKRYMFNASVAVKREDKVGIPLYLTLNEGFVEEAAPFPPLSPTTRNIDFKTAKKLKINLFRGIREFFNNTSTDAEGVSSSSAEAAGPSKTGTPRFLPKSITPSSSARAIPEIIHTESWRALKTDREIASSKYYPPSRDKVPLNTVDKNIDKSVMSGNMLTSGDKNSDDLLVHSMPIPHSSVLDHDYIRPASSEGKSRNIANERVYYFIETLKKAKKEEKKKPVDLKSLSNERWKGDLKAVATDLDSLTVASASRATADHGEKEAGEIETGKKAAVSVPYNAAGECSAVFDSADSHGKSEQPTAVHHLTTNVKVRENYFADLGSKINVLTPDGKRPFQSGSTLKAERSPMSRQQGLLCSFSSKGQLNQPRIKKRSPKEDYTDEDLYFMTEEEQIIAACKRSIADQLEKDSGTSAEISRESDEERSHVQCTDELMSQKLSPNTSEPKDYIRKVEKEESEQSVNKLISQKSQSSDTNVDLNMEEIVTETGDHPGNLKKQGDQNIPETEGVSEPLESFENRDLNLEVEVPTEKKDFPERFKKQRREFRSGWNFNSNGAQKIVVYEDEVGIEALEGQVNTAHANEEAMQGDDQPLELPENIAPNNNSNDLFVYEDTNQSDEKPKFCPEYVWKTSRNMDNTVDENANGAAKGTALSKAVTPLSVKSPNDGKDSKLMIKSANNFDVECAGNSEEESSQSTISDDLSSTDGKEVFDIFGPQPVPFIPLSCENRQAICMYLGMDFNADWMQIIGFEMEHVDEFAAIKDWTYDNWTCHMRLLAETGLGGDLELYAFATMFNVDVWVFYKEQWLCYRPKFRKIGGKWEEINIEDYCIGENEGVYLMYDHCLFSPVVTPSNEIFLKNIVLSNSDDSSDTNFMQENAQPEDVHDNNADVICDAAAATHEDNTGASYRLISVVSHLGQTANSGHYICDVWCNKSRRWLFCNDESIAPIDEKSVLDRCRCGYVYLYLNR